MSDELPFNEIVKQIKKGILYFKSNYDQSPIRISRSNGDQLITIYFDMVDEK